MAEKARTETMEGSEQSQLGQQSSGNIIFRSHPSWPIYKASILPESSGNRPTLQVDISQISTDWPHNLTNGQELRDNEHKEKRELDKTPPLIDDVSNEEKLSNLFKRLSNNPEEVDVVADFLRQRDATSSFSKVAKAEPAPAPRHADAPPLWAERTTGREVSPVDWIRMHYGNRDPNNWDALGLTRDQIRRIDRALYQAFCTFVSRATKAEDPAPSGFEALFESPRHRVAAELQLAGIKNPTDAYKVAGLNLATAERLYQAAKRRQLRS